MELSKRQRRHGPATEVPAVVIAHVYGDEPPDFAAIAACGFGVVLLDTAAPWFSETTVAEAKAQGLMAVAFRMGES